MCLPAVMFLLLAVKQHKDHFLFSPQRSVIPDSSSEKYMYLYNIRFLQTADIFRFVCVTGLCTISMSRFSVQTTYQVVFEPRPDQTITTTRSQDKSES